MSGNKKQAIICDIDGCIVDTSWIWEDTIRLNINGEKRWEYFNANACNMDKNKIISQTLYVLNNIHFNKDIEIIISTARSEEIRPETEKMLNEILNRDYVLYMRPLGNIKRAPEVKEAHLKEILKKYKVVLAIDDEFDNLAMFSKRNIFCLWSDFQNIRSTIPKKQETVKENEVPVLVQA